MVSDVVQISSTGEGTSEALAETERVAAYRGLNSKQALRLRLLAEEMTGMLKTIVGPARLRYWIESEGMAFSLHVSAKAELSYEMRETLLKASSSGKNSAAKGFMGRIREIFTYLCEPNDLNAMSMEYGYSYIGVTNFDASMDSSPNAALYGWSLKAYRDAVAQHKDEEPEKWDELEKSITANLADEIEIFIRNSTVELVIEKNF